MNEEAQVEVSAIQFHRELNELCEKYRNVVLKSGLERCERTSDKVIFREYTISVKIQKDESILLGN